ncbi:MAG: DUF2807 domain-containing protein [Dokdonella sp.]
MRTLIATILLLASSTVFADNCRFTEPRNLDIDASGLRLLAMEFGSDDMNLEGVAGLERIEIRGRACGSSQEALDSLSLQQASDGDGVFVKVDKGDRKLNWNGWFGSNYAYIDLEVRVPKRMQVSVKRGSGDVTIENVAGIDSTGGSGDLKANDISGPVVIKTGSGDARLRDVGPINVRALGSGDIEADGVRGDVQVGSGGSGDLDFSDVTGNVNVDHVGSGDVTARDVSGNLHVGSIGSGDVRANDIGGDLTVESQGSGDTSHSGVKGRVDIPKHDA